MPNSQSREKVKLEEIKDEPEFTLDDVHVSVRQSRLNCFETKHEPDLTIVDEHSNVEYSRPIQSVTGGEPEFTTKPSEKFPILVKPLSYRRIFGFD